MAGPLIVMWCFVGQGWAQPQIEEDSWLEIVLKKHCFLFRNKTSVNASQGSSFSTILLVLQLFQDQVWWKSKKERILLCVPAFLSHLAVQLLWQTLACLYV